MIKLLNLIKEIDTSYRGEHTAPDATNGSPLHDVSGIYPDDIYTLDIHTAVRYYGDLASQSDYTSMNIIRYAHNKPNLQIKIYRAVPSVITTQDKINDIEKQQRYILKYGKIPTDVNTPLNVNKYYDQLCRELEMLSKNSDANNQKIKINNGDWVTISRQYAVEHGRSTLLNKYKILTKTVAAKNLFTTGDNLSEWGYSV